MLDMEPHLGEFRDDILTRSSVAPSKFPWRDASTSTMVAWSKSGNTSRSLAAFAPRSDSEGSPASCELGVLPPGPSSPAISLSWTVAALVSPLAEAP